MKRTNLQDQAPALIFGVEDSLSLRIMPRFLAVNEGKNVLDSDRQVHARAVFPRDEEEFSCMRVELKVVHSCPSGGFS